MLKLLDLFCGAGGAAVGYAQAGFEVVGVDLKPQPHYPFEFHRRGEAGHGLTEAGTNLRQYTRNNGKTEFVTKTGTTEPGYGLTQWQNGAQANGLDPGIGHNKGWRLAAEAMGIDWMNRAEPTQAIPPVYAAYLGERLSEWLGNHA